MQSYGSWQQSAQPDEVGWRCGPLSRFAVFPRREVFAVFDPLRIDNRNTCGSSSSVLTGAISSQMDFSAGPPDFSQSLSFSLKSYGP